MTTCKEQWVLNSQNCTSVTTGFLCNSVSTTDAFNKLRDCVTDKDPTLDSFDKMKNYLQGQNIMMNKMIIDLTGASEATPKSNVSIIDSQFLYSSFFDTVLISLDS